MKVIAQWFFEKLYIFFFSFFPPLCVFCYKFLGGKQVSLYLLQHDKSISRGADTGLVETKWAQENRKIKNPKSKLIQLQNHITTW